MIAVKKCEAYECSRPAASASAVFCTGHYRRLERAVKRWVAENKRPPSRSTLKRLEETVRASGPLRLRRSGGTVVCSERGCDKVAVKRGFCNMHYTRHYREGTLPPARTVEA